MTGDDVIGVRNVLRTLYGRDAVLSLDEPSIRDDDAPPLVETIPGPWATPEEIAAARERARFARRLLRVLPPREHGIIVLRFGLTERGEGWSLALIGAFAAVSKQRVQVLEQRALATLRQAAVSP